MLGPIHLSVRQLKEKVVKKVDVLINVLFCSMRVRIEELNLQVGFEVDTVLKVIKHKQSYRDIEEVTEVRGFLKRMPDKMQEIRFLVKEAMAFMTLLEQY